MRPHLRLSMVLVGSLAVIAMLARPIMLAGPAVAASTPPRANISYYANNDLTKMHTLGCDQGNRDASLHSSSLVVLDFGGQTATGTILIGGGSVSLLQIENLAASFAQSYYQCTGSDTSTVLTLAMGTNNSLNESSAAGAIWATEVVTTEALITSMFEASQVTIEAANDFEAGFGTALNAEAWLTGYGFPALMYNYGSADGCPQSGAGPCNYVCMNGVVNCHGPWTQAEYSYLSYGAAPSFGFPEIYNNATALQWAAISANAGFISFRATLSQALACLQRPQAGCSGANEGPDTSWQQLNAATGQAPSYSDDIGFSSLST